MATRSQLGVPQESFLEGGWEDSQKLMRGSITHIKGPWSESVEQDVPESLMKASLVNRISIGTLLSSAQASWPGVSLTAQEHFLSLLLSALLSPLSPILFPTRWELESAQCEGRKLKNKVEKEWES
jgi:hypothetical protein